MKHFNLLSSAVPSTNKLSDEQIRNFNSKMREVAIQVAINSHRANESAKKVIITSLNK